MMLVTVIRTYRQQQNLSLRAFAKLTGISYVTLHRLENGRAIMSDEWAKLWRWLLSMEEKT